MYIYRVGVVGAGTMGSQIAQVISFAGIPVVLTDVSRAIAERGVESVRRIYQARVDKGKMTGEQLEEKMLLVGAADDFAALTDVDLVIEAVSEDLRLKHPRGGGPKYLERALTEVAPSLEGIVASRVEARTATGLTSSRGRSHHKGG